MATILISKEGKYTAHVNNLLNPENDGNIYRVTETGFVSEHEKVAINNARAFLKRKRRVLKRGNARIKKLSGKTEIKREDLHIPFVPTVKHNWLNESGFVRNELCYRCNKETLILTGQYQDSDYTGILFCRCSKCSTLRNITWKRKAVEPIPEKVKVIRKRKIKPKVVRRRRS